MVGKLERAKMVIEQFNPGENIEQQMEEITQSIKDGIVDTSISVLFKRPFLKIVLVGITIGMLGALTGINTIMYYAPTIFQSVGFSNDSALFQTLWIGAINLVFTIIGMSLIDRIGRKFLLMAGAIGMSIFLFLIFLTLEFSWFNNYALLAGVWAIRRYSHLQWA